jgi:hypothetical protein
MGQAGRRTDGTFSREDFTYDHAGDVDRCPGGKTLKSGITDAPINGFGFANSEVLGRIVRSSWYTSRDA